MNSVATVGMERGLWRIRWLWGFGARGGKRQERVADLPVQLLSDIGVTRQDYRGATGRMYWDAPDHWFDDPARR